MVSSGAPIAALFGGGGGCIFQQIYRFVDFFLDLERELGADRHGVLFRFCCFIAGWGWGILFPPQQVRPRCFSYDL